MTCKQASDTIYRVGCSRCQRTWPVVGEFMAQATAVSHGLAPCYPGTPGHYVWYCLQADDCYCAALPGTVCDQCVQGEK